MSELIIEGDDIILEITGAPGESGIEAVRRLLIAASVDVTGKTDDELLSLYIGGTAIPAGVDAGFLARGYEELDTGVLSPVYDTVGNLLSYIKNGDLFLGSAGPTARIAAMRENSVSVARSADMLRPHNWNIGLRSEYNLFLTYGQSGESGRQGFPTISRTAVPGALMMGASAHPDSARGPSWNPIGALQLNPLVANAVPMTDGRTVYSRTAEDALNIYTAIGQGEFPLNFAAMFMARKLNAAPYASAPGWKPIVVAEAALDGGTIEELQKTAPPMVGYSANAYQRPAQAVDKFVTVTTGHTRGVCALIMNQGTANYGPPGSGETFTDDKDPYRVLYSQVLGDLQADFKTKTGQAYDVLICVEPPPARAIRDHKNMAINMAQYEYALSTPGVILLPNMSFVTSATLHADANGQLWKGAYIGKVLDHVFNRGLYWEPPMVRKVWNVGRFVYVTFTAMQGPMRFVPYIGPQGSLNHYFTTLLDNYGLEVDDPAGPITVAGGQDGIQWIGSHTLEIELVRIPLDGWSFWLGRHDVAGTPPIEAGGHNVCDSDRTLVGAIGQITGNVPSDQIGSDVAAMINGKDLPLPNWAINGWYPGGYERAFA